MLRNLRRVAGSGLIGWVGVATPAWAADAPATPWWATPLLSGLVGVASAYVAIWFDRRKTSNQELIKKRIAVYDDIAPKLNELYCFLLARGMFRTLTPPEMVAHKRALDQAVYVYGPLFSQPTFERYQAFIHTCFKPFVGSGHDAQLKGDLVRLRREYGRSWKRVWDRLFVAPEEAAPVGEIDRTYQRLMAELGAQIGAPRRRGGLASALRRLGIRI